MDDAKPGKLIGAVLITVIVIFDCFLPASAGDAFLGYIMTQVTVFLASLWGYQAIRDSHQVSQRDEWIRGCLFIHKWTWRILLILPLLWVMIALVASFKLLIPPLALVIAFIFALFLGSFLFLVLIVLTTILANQIRGRFLLHCVTMYCLFAAHLLCWLLIFRGIATIHV